MIAAAPIIVSALFGAEDFAWLDGLRRAHFPPERNHLGAHLTLFHHLPAARQGEIGRYLSELTQVAPPPAMTDGLIPLGRGVAIRIWSPELAALRAELAGAFADSLTTQDAAPWRAHVTIQNKVSPHEARDLLQALQAGLTDRPVRLTGLAAWWYRGGPWELMSQHPFRRVR